MKNFKLSSKLLMGAAIACAFTFSMSSCSDDDDEKPKVTAPSGSGNNTISYPNKNGDSLTFIKDDISVNTTWTSSSIYILQDRIVVRNGATLTIQAGTIIKGEPGEEADAKPLVVAKGSKIVANGTAAQPIVFTSRFDDIARGEIVGSNLGLNDVGLWAGLIILGDAPISPNSGTTARIEGIPAQLSEGIYGGSNPADSSGSLQYVSVRHGGVELVPGGGNEINGITLGGVGSGTVMNHVEVVANLDDGFEWFGGSVNASNLLVAYQKDDAYDIDQAFSGTLTNLAYFGATDSEDPFEIDGPEGTPVTPDQFSINGGYISGSGGGLQYAIFKSGAKGNVQNLYFTNFAGGLTFDLLGGSVNANYDAGSLSITNNVFNLPAGETLSGIANSDQAVNTFNSTFGVNNTTGTAAPSFDKSQFMGWSWASAKGLLDGI